MGGRSVSTCRYLFHGPAGQLTADAVPAPRRPPTWTGPALPAGEQPGLEATRYYSPPHATWASGVHACLVEVDVETGVVRVLRYCVVHDCGRLINPLVVDGQIHGGVAQGVGGALLERLAYDEQGQLLNTSFLDFLLPTTEDVPFVEVRHQETPSPITPLGMKGLGEAGAIPGPALLASAIDDALQMPGAVTELPVTPVKLKRLIERARAR